MCKLLLSRGASPGPAPWHPPGAGQRRIDSRRAAPPLRDIDICGAFITPPTSSSTGRNRRATRARIS